MLLQLLQSNQNTQLTSLILSPTRELAVQIHECILALGSCVSVKSVCIYGGVDIIEQKTALMRRPHVVVATPGRIVDHLQTTVGFSLSTPKTLALDEADRLLDADFANELSTLLSVIPQQRRTLMFSATMTKKVEKLKRASLKNPVAVSVSEKYSTVDTLVQNYLFMPLKYKDHYLLCVLRSLAGSSVIIFVATCEGCERLNILLNCLQIPAVSLNGRMSQNKRLSSLLKFKSGDVNTLVCTDVASRGLDIPEVDLVVNYDLPAESKAFVHRVGQLIWCEKPRDAGRLNS